MGLLNKVKQTLWVLQFEVESEAEDHIIATKTFKEKYAMFNLTVDADTNGIYLLLSMNGKIVREVPAKLIKNFSDFTKILHRALGYISKYNNYYNEFI